MSPSYELFDHTADLGLRVRAATPEALIRPATDAFYAAIGELTVRPGVAERRIEVSLGAVAAGPGDAAAPAHADAEPAAHAARALLLRDYLAELLVLFERASLRYFPKRVEEFSTRRLAVNGLAAAVDLERSALLREVKAVTYHELAIRPIPGGFEATIIVDI